MKKKALSLALALVMCLGLTVPAFAAEYAPYTITRNGEGAIAGGTLTFDKAIASETAITVQRDTTITWKADGDFGGTAIFFEYKHDGGDWTGFNTAAADIELWTGQSVQAGERFDRAMRIAAETMETISTVSIDETRFRFDAGTEKYYIYLEDATRTVPPMQPASASPTNDSLTADGMLQNPTVYKIDGSNYFKIRDLAAILNGTGKQFSVGYDSSLNSVTATTGQGYAKQAGDLAGAPAGGTKTAQPSNDAIYINGVKVDAQVYKIDGSNYFKLRDLGKALNFYVGWSADKGMYIETDKGYTE